MFSYQALVILSLIKGSSKEIIFRHILVLGFISQQYEA